MLFGVGVAMVSGTGQFFWWKKMNRENVRKEFITPVLITLVLWAMLLSQTGLKPIYLALSFTGIYIIVSNIKVLITILKATPRLSGGAPAQVRMGMVLTGIRFAAG